MTTPAPPTRPARPGGCRDCLGRDRFAGHDPEAPSAPDALTAAAPRSWRHFLHAHRRAVTILVALVVLAIAALVLLPQLTGLGNTLRRMREGDKTWLAVGVACEALSLGAYMAIFHAVFCCDEARISFRASAQITLAGVVATKLFSAAGAGGVALTVWALRASGLRGRTIARRLTAMEILLYAVYMGALVIVGAGLRLGLLPGPRPFTMTVLPALFGAAAIVLALAAWLLPADIERRLTGGPHARARRLRARLATVPGTIRSGIVTALELLAHPRPGLLGAVGYWGFDMAALWASFHAYGSAPPLPVLIMAYFVGMLGNTLPIPGGIGGVEGGMIGSFIAFGVSGSLAVLAVLTYRLISYWLPMIPGAFAYFRLRGTVAAWRTTERSDARPRDAAPVSG
jgi:uncharacterized membrane protein YbhN (UPF0104 family)